MLFFICTAIPLSGFSTKNDVPKSVVNKDVITDSVKKDSLVTAKKPLPIKQKSNQIDAQITYSAKDSIVFLGNGTGFLHGESDITYKKINLKADFVRIKMDSSIVYAHGTIDSLGARKGSPVFKEGETEYTSKELNYNLKTKKGFIRQAVTKQGEGYIISDKTKKTDDDVLCIANAKYTTCDNHDHPDFYLSLSRGKVKTGKYIVAGPSHLVVCDVPLPIALPFGFFPFTDKYSSGILMPSYVDELTRGFGLTNGGYYFAINDYMDMEIRGDVYTKGTWALSASSRYRKNYKYSGSLSINYREDVTGEKDLADYTKNKNLSIRLSHMQDAKANPYRTLSSSVDFSTSGYNKSNINNYSRPELVSKNVTSSSVSFSQRFPESPFNVSGSMNISQRSSDSTISLTLPNISISMSRIYPLKRKNAIGKERWYEKISMSYSGTLDNRIDTKEKLLLTSSLSKDWKNGMMHSIPVSATFNALKYINISPSANYTERWYLQSYDKSWDKASQQEVTTMKEGFHRVYDYNFGVSASTKLYGFYIPIRSIFGDKIDRIRHVVTPSVGFSYRPDFGESKYGYYSNYTRSVLDKTDLITGYRQEDVQYSHYDGSLYGTPGRGKSGSVNMSLGNSVEMKVRNDKDTTGNEPFKIISLIDNFTINTGYNLAADSLKWSNFSTNLRIKFGKSYSLSLSGDFDPYMYGLSKSGYPVRINKLRWNNGQFPRFLGTSTSYSYTLSNETFKKKGKTKNTADLSKDNQMNDSQLNNNDESNSNKEVPQKKVEKTDDGYAKVTVPWSISASYSVRYGNSSVFNKDKMEFEMDFTHNLSLSGKLDLTANWSFDTSTSYDFKYKQFTYTSLNIRRNLHCWTATASVVPFGPYKTYNIHIGVNASMLSDLKYEKRSGREANNITWY